MRLPRPDLPIEIVLPIALSSRVKGKNREEHQRKKYFHRPNLVSTKRRVKKLLRGN
jgi:hypothetical protein